MGVLAVTATWDNALTWAVLVGWILSVVLHEFSHGLVAYWGGDYTIRERGGLTLNPFQYIDPLMSIAMPAMVLLMGDPLARRCDLHPHRSAPQQGLGHRHLGGRSDRELLDFPRVSAAVPPQDSLAAPTAAGEGELLDARMSVPWPGCRR